MERGAVLASDPELLDGSWRFPQAESRQTQLKFHQQTSKRLNHLWVSSPLTSIKQTRLEIRSNCSFFEKFPPEAETTDPHKGCFQISQTKALHFMVKLSTKEHKEAKYQTTWNQRSVLDHDTSPTFHKAGPRIYLNLTQNFHDLNDQQTQAATHTVSRLYIHHSQMECKILPNTPFTELSPPARPPITQAGCSHLWWFQPLPLGHHQSVSVFLCEESSLIPSTPSPKPPDRTLTPGHTLAPGIRLSASARVLPGTPGYFCSISHPRHRLPICQMHLPKFTSIMWLPCSKIFSAFPIPPNQNCLVFKVLDNCA